MADRLAFVSEILRSTRGVVFDKDGTLVSLDTRWVPFFRAFVDGVVAGPGRAALREELLASIGVEEDRLVPDGPAAVATGRELRERVVAELVARGREVAATRSVVERAYRAARHGPVVGLGDVTVTFAALFGRGLRLGIATSDDRTTTMAELETLGLTGFVSATSCGDDPGPSKPDPGVLWAICEQWSLPPSTVVFVGDSRQDLDTARAAGATFVAIESGPSREWSDGADAWVATVDELAAAFGGPAGS